jgi:hypothetical protein
MSSKRRSGVSHFQSLRSYEDFIYDLPNLFPVVVYSTLVAVRQHVPPDMKHNRVPAPGLSFTQLICRS